MFFVECAGTFQGKQDYGAKNERFLGWKVDQILSSYFWKLFLLLGLFYVSVFRLLEMYFDAFWYIFRRSGSIIKAENYWFTRLKKEYNCFTHFIQSIFYLRLSHRVHRNSSFFSGEATQTDNNFIADLFHGNKVWGGSKNVSLCKAV